MASVQQIAGAHYRRQVALARRISREILALWRSLSTANLTGSWNSGVGARMVAVVAAGQMLAASDADPYVTAVLEAQAIDPVAAGALIPRAFAGIASDGRALDSLLFEPVIAVKQAIGSGASVRQAMLAAQVDLDMIARTQIADAGRTATGTVIAARAKVGGYVRMLNPPSCSRCAVLAGRWYRWNAGFQRHPRCDCRHIPTSEDMAGDLRLDPREYFDSLDIAEQDRAFTKAGAQAIRDGANIGQVVNARRGMYTASAGRLKVQATHEGTTVRGLFGGYEIGPDGKLRRRDANELAKQGRYRRVKALRLMPEQIYLEAGGNRDEAIRLLRRFGYIT